MLLKTFKNQKVVELVLFIYILIYFTYLFPWLIQFTNMNVCCLFNFSSNNPLYFYQFKVSMLCRIVSFLTIIAEYLLFDMGWWYEGSKIFIASYTNCYNIANCFCLRRFIILLKYSLHTSSWINSFLFTTNFLSLTVTVMHLFVYLCQCQAFNYMCILLYISNIVIFMWIMFTSYLHFRIFHF